MAKTDVTVAEWEKIIAKSLEEHAEVEGKTYPLEWSAGEGMHKIHNKYITADLIRHFAYCIGDANPLWSDPSYAKNTGWGGIIAPPAFEDYVASPHMHRRPLGMEIPGANQFDGGHSREYFSVLHAGDQVIRGIDTYLGIIEKTTPGKVYRLFVEMGQRTLYNQRGEKVVNVIGNGIITCIPPGKIEEFQEQVAGNIVRPHYTKKQLDELHAHYEDELSGKHRRGAEIRYWEDVNEGDEITTIMKGPLDDSDLRAYMGWMSSGGTVMHRWKRVKEFPEPIIDPDTGAYKGGWAWHDSDADARNRGIPYALAEGKENCAEIGHGVTNWIGDDGVVKKLDLQNRAINYHGDMNWIKGKVARKYVENGEHLVDLDLMNECQDGRVNTKGMGIVRLLSRAG